MASPEPITGVNEKVEEPWKLPQRPGKLGVDHDELGMEMAPNARVWKKYVEETDKADKELVEGWNNSLDIILIFAALFSAISTAFVIESSKDLKPDYSQTSAQTLQLMSQTLSAIARGSPLDDLNSTVAEIQEFTPSSFAIAVNVLWFLSLSLSVAVSLIAILAKEWCHSFMTGRVGSMLRQARLRQQRWDGIERWKMKEILYVLPLLMHTALLLFAVGLSLYLWDIDIRVALPVVVTTSLAGLFYVVTVSLPLFFRFCPYTTALARFIYPYWLAILANRHTLEVIGALVASLGWITHVCVRMRKIINCRVRFAIQGHFKDDIEATRDSQPDTSPFLFRDKMEDAHDPLRNWVESMRAMFSTDRSQLVQKDTPMDDVSCSMVTWMILNCEDPRSVDIALQALAGAGQLLPRQPLWECGVVDILCQRIEESTDVLARRTFRRLQAVNDSLLDDASLFSRSLNFLTAYVMGEGLDMTNKSEPCFATNNNHELATKLQNTAERARDCIRDQIGWILHYAWSQPSPRYDLVAYELNVIPVKASTDQWLFMEGFRQQCQKQQELIQLLASGRISNLPDDAVVALVNGITKTYLYNPLQSPMLLLDQLESLDAQNYAESKYKCLLAVGLAVVGLVAGGYRGEDNTENEAPTNEARLELARDAYTHLTEKGPDILNSQTLLCFGLLTLLDPETGDLWAFSAAGIELIGSHLGRSWPIRSYHDVLPDILPFSFSLGDHIAQVLSRLLDAASPNKKLETSHKSVSLTLSRIDAVLNRLICELGDDQVVPLLTQHFSSTDSARLKQLCLRGIKYSLEGFSDRQELVLDSLVKTGLLTQVMEVTISTHDDQTMVPYCMEFLWEASQKLLRLTARWEPESCRSVARYLLESLDSSFKTSLAKGGLLDNRDEMGLANLWLLKIDEICHSDPQSVLDSNLLSAMVKYYDDEHADIKPQTTELPTPFDSTWTWLQILWYWEEICQEVIENQAQDSVLPEKDAESIYAKCGVGRYERESGSVVDMHDWSI